MASEFNPEEEERICRLIKHHGGEIVLNPTGDGEQVIIDFDDIMELIRAAKRQERADILLAEPEPTVDALIADLGNLPRHIDHPEIDAIIDKYRSKK